MPEHPAPADSILAGVRATAITRQIVALAAAGGLRPQVDGADCRQGSVRIILNGPGRDALFGAIYVGGKTGRILRALLTHGNGGEEKRYDRVADIRVVLASWLALYRSAPDYVRGADPDDRPLSESATWAGTSTRSRWQTTTGALRDTTPAPSPIGRHPHLSRGEH